LIRESRFLRALLLIGWLYSLLLWLYIILRILGEDALLFLSFLDIIPWLLYWELGILSFLFSAGCMFLYLYYWGFSGGIRGEKRSLD
jgi:hypothetical protein